MQPHHQPLSSLNYYDLLNVSPAASYEEIKVSYRNLVLQYHPDKKKQQQQLEEEAEERPQQYSSLNDLDDDENDNETMVNETTNEINSVSSPSSQQQQTKEEEEELEILQQKFNSIQLAWETLRNTKNRQKYDDDLHSQQYQQLHKMKYDAKIQLSQMNCELCHVVGSDEDDIDEQEEEKNDTEQLQKVYTYSCRCGDEFEIVEEDIITMNGQPPSNDNGPKMRKGEGGNNECLFQCQSCSLSLLVELDLVI